MTGFLDMEWASDELERALDLNRIQTISAREHPLRSLIRSSMRSKVSPTTMPHQVYALISPNDQARESNPRICLLVLVSSRRPRNGAIDLGIAYGEKPNANLREAFSQDC
jgi:hypothetical protein